MTTTPNVHGHEILHMVDQARPALTRGALEEEARKRFGAAARYCTCSAADMTLGELLDFLLAHGKLVEREGRVVADISKMCGGGSH